MCFVTGMSVIFYTPSLSTTMVDDDQRKVVDIKCVSGYCTVSYLFIPLTLSTMMVDDAQWKVVDITCVFGYCSVS